MDVNKVGVLGCGLMGSGIAQVCATAGFAVTVLEVEQKFLDKGFAGIEKSLAKFAERPPENGGITAREIVGTTVLSFIQLRRLRVSRSTWSRFGGTSLATPP